MHVQVLIDEIVRQTTVLIAQLSTAAGLRAPLSHIADQVFLELAKELDTQGVRRKVVADMFGLALRSYQTKVRRLSDGDGDSGKTLWQSLHDDLAEGSRARGELEQRHRPYTPKQVAAALADMVESGLAYSSGKGTDAVFGLTSDADRRRLTQSEQRRVVSDLAWYLVASGAASSRQELSVQLRETDVDAVVDELIEKGALMQQAQELSARRFDVNVGDEHGWETSVLDHFRAVTTAIAAKLSRPKAQAGDQIGGGTRSFIVYEQHPYRSEVLSLLDDTRRRTRELWEKVSEYNQRVVPPPGADRVTFYFGQNVVIGAGEDESAESEENGQ